MNLLSRRTMLGKASILGTTVAMGVPLTATTAEPPTKERPSASPRFKVVVTGGHPGDPEYGCGGTVARYSELGHEVVLLYLNPGDWSDKPGYDPSPLRVAEANKACQILKARPAFAVLDWKPMTRCANNSVSARPTWRSPGCCTKRL